MRSLKEPFYLLGIPFLLYMRNSIFFENVIIFAIPGRLNPDILFISWMIIIWILVRNWNVLPFISKIDNSHKIQRSNVVDYFIIGLMVISIFGFIMVSHEYTIVDNVFIEFYTLFSLFLGYFLVKDIVSRFRPELLADFLFSVVLVNSLASCLFILHQGLHFPIYQYEEYLAETFQGVVITRSFWFAPILCGFSIAYLLVFKKSKSLFIIILIIINLLAIFITYTRSSIITIIFIILLYYLLNGIKNNDISLIVKNIIIISALGVFLFFIVSYFLPANTNFFLERFKELDNKSSTSGPNNLTFRFERTGGVFEKVELDKALLGYGPVTDTQMPFVEIMRAITSDSVWAGVIFRWGYLGLLFFISVYVISLVKAFYLFIKSDGLLSSFGLFFFLILTVEAIGSFISCAFMSPNRFGLGLWYFGMLSALCVMDNSLLIPRNEELKAN